DFSGSFFAGAGAGDSAANTIAGNANRRAKQARRGIRRRTVRPGRKFPSAEKKTRAGLGAGGNGRDVKSGAAEVRFDVGREERAGFRGGAGAREVIEVFLALRVDARERECELDVA